MQTTAVALFEHNLWANLKLIDFCARLGEEKLNASAVGTYGAVKSTLIHLSGGEERYVSILSGREAPTPRREDREFAGFDELRVAMAASGEALVRFAGETNPTTMLHGTRRGEPYAMKAALPFIQAVNHATEHRAQIAIVLTQAGIEPPALDGWAYAVERALISES